MPTISRLCPRLLLLDRGRIVADGETEQVIGQYLHGAHGSSAKKDWPDPASAPGDRHARLRSARVVDGAGITSDVVESSGEVGVEIVFEILDSEMPIIPWIDFVDDGGSAVFSAADPDPGAFETRRPGMYSSTAWIPEHLLNDGTLHVHVSLKSPLLGRKPWRHAEVESALTFQVVDPEDRATARGGFSGRIHGPVRPLLRWSTHALEPEDAPLLGRRRD